MIVSIISIIVLFIEFILIRYPLFGIQRTTVYPLILLIFCVLIILGAFISRATVTSLATSGSYLAGYFIAELLKNWVNANNGASDNMWIIWLLVILVVAILSELLN